MTGWQRQYLLRKRALSSCSLSLWRRRRACRRGVAAAWRAVREVRRRRAITKRAAKVTMVTPAGGKAVMVVEDEDEGLEV